MDSFFNNAIQKLGHFSADELDQVIQTAGLKNVSKNELLLSSGEICESFFFIKEGALFQYLPDKEMQKTIVDLHCRGDWVVNMQSFTQRHPSQYFICAHEDSLVYELKVEALHRLIGEFPGMVRLGGILGAESFRTRLFDNDFSPPRKYEYLFRYKPELLQYFPLYMIASFLKITPETLSRVRSRSIS